MARRVPKPWAVKPPPGTPIDPSNPLARGLVMAALLNEGAGQKVRNYAPKIGSLATGTALTWSGDAKGKAAKFNGSSSWASFGTDSRLRGTGAFSVAIRFYLDALVIANSPCLYSTGYDGTNLNLFIGFNGRGGGDSKLWIITNTSTGDASSATSFAGNLNKWYDVLLEYTGSGYNIEINGVAESLGGNKVAARSSNYRGTSIGSIDLNNTPSWFLNGRVSHVLHWEGRNLTAPEKRLVREAPYSMFAPSRRPTFIGVNQATGTIAAVDACSVSSSLDSSYLASYFASQAISNAMASAAAVQSSTAGINAVSESQSVPTGLAAWIYGADGSALAASSSDIQTATILVIDASGAAVSAALSNIVTQDVLVAGVDATTNGQALFQATFSATAGVDGSAVGQAIGISGQSAIVNVDGSAVGASAVSAGAAIVLASDGAGESASVAVAPGIGIFGADGAAGSAIGYATSSVDVQSIGAVPGASVGHVAGDAFSGATAIVSGTSRAHSVVTGNLAGVIGKDGRDVAVAVVRAPKAIVLAKDARSESNSVAKAGRAGIGASAGKSESQAVARGDATTTVTANYPVAIDMTTVPPDAWMVLVPIETTTASVSVYGDDVAVPQEVTTVTVPADDAVQVPVDTWKVTA